jgi:hypothetical protein
MNEAHHPLKGALWAPAHSGYRPTLMGVFFAAGKGYKCEKNPEPYIGEVQFSLKTPAASDDE